MSPSPSPADDRDAIRSLAVAYAEGADRRHYPAVGALFADDGVLRPAKGHRTGPDEIAAALTGLDRYEVTFHLLGQHRVDLDPHDPDRATGEVYCVAHHLFTDGAGGARTDRIMYIRYQDEYRRTAPGWRFAERRLEIDWIEERPVHTVG